MRPLIALLSALLLPGPPAALAEDPTPRDTDFAQLTRGGKLFAQHCAQCHGQNAEGAANWRQRLPDGRFPPPPLNGSGHAWHHPEQELKEVIIFGRNQMPAWNGKLGRQDVDDLVAWFQSKWPEETYRVWAAANARAKGLTQTR